MTAQCPRNARSLLRQALSNDRGVGLTRLLRVVEVEHALPRPERCVALAPFERSKEELKPIVHLCTKALLALTKAVGQDRVSIGAVKEGGGDVASMPPQRARDTPFGVIAKAIEWALQCP